LCKGGGTGHLWGAEIDRLDRCTVHSTRSDSTVEEEEEKEKKKKVEK
jgi:hypothetical protein